MDVNVDTVWHVFSREEVEKVKCSEIHICLRKVWVEDLDRKKRNHQYFGGNGNFGLTGKATRLPRWLSQLFFEGALIIEFNIIWKSSFFEKSRYPSPKFYLWNQNFIYLPAAVDIKHYHSENYSLVHFFGNAFGNL